MDAQAFDPVVALRALQARAVPADLHALLAAPGLLEAYETALWSDLATGAVTQDQSSLAQELAAAWRAYLHPELPL